jgi:aspartyl-tRNA(Asn)/glutamyl-tRNA(Gln) amidotransferase subunit A
LNPAGQGGKLSCRTRSRVTEDVTEERTAQMGEEVFDATLRELARDLRAGDLDARELAETVIARHEANAGLDAYRAFDAEHLRVQARAADAALAAEADPGPLTGIPFSVKDLFAVKGFDTYAGSPRPLPGKWEREGPVVHRLRKQLAPVTGKTHTVEFAFGGIGTNPHFPTPRNPWDPNVHRVPGGSSAGAGVSLAEGSALLALGTDTAGSVRVPASFTGHVGLRPTAGRWSIEGIVPLSHTFDSPGVLVRSVDDLIHVFGALDPHWDGPDALEQALEPLGAEDLRLGMTDVLFWDGCAAAIADPIHAAVDDLVRQGSRVRTIDLDESRSALDVFRRANPAGVELYAFLSRELPDWLSTLDPNVGARVEAGKKVAAVDYVANLSELGRLARSAEQRMREIDVLVTPTVAIGPPTVEDVSTEEGYRTHNLLALRNTSVPSYLGMCAVTLPVGRDAAGMPVGMQLVAPGGREERLLSAARAIEQVLGTPAERLGPPPAVRSAGS